MLAKTKVKEIQDAVIIVKKLTRSEEMRDRARREEEGQHDLTMRLNYAHDKGVAEEKERRKADIERAIAVMRANNVPEDQIQASAKCSGRQSRIMLSHFGKIRVFFFLI